MNSYVKRLLTLMKALRRHKLNNERSVNKLNNSILYAVLSPMNGKELARMMATSTRYRNFIKNHPVLRRRVVNSRKNITMKHVQEHIREILNNAPFWAYTPNNQREIINHIMALPNNVHPLTLDQVRIASRKLLMGY